jgi:hypothetical protein
MYTHLPSTWGDRPWPVRLGNPHQLRFRAGKMMGKWWENMGENWENHINEVSMRKIIELNGWFSIAMFDYQRVMVGTWLESSSRLGLWGISGIAPFLGHDLHVAHVFLNTGFGGDVSWETWFPSLECDVFGDTTPVICHLSQPANGKASGKGQTVWSWAAGSVLLFSSPTRITRQKAWLCVQLEIKIGLG